MFLFVIKYDIILVVITMFYILYNPLSSNGKSVELIKDVEKALLESNEEIKAIDLVRVSKNIPGFVRKIKPEDKFVILGGDGTLHRFANEIKNIPNQNEIYLYKGGTGNDFSREFKNQKLINITTHIRNLPRYQIEGEDFVFLNSCGFGIDGAVCAAVNESKTKKSGLEYAKKLLTLLKTFPRYDLEVEVDGVRHSFKKVWLAAVCNGQYFGGGMRISPTSDRTDDVLEFYVLHTLGFAKLLCIFPSIFIGKHMWFKKSGITFLTGRKFKLTSSHPLPFQSDGEVVLDVKEFSIEIDELDKK